MTTRSGTETRKRSKLIGVRFTPEEYAAVERRAAAKGVRPTVLVREVVLEVVEWGES